MTNSKTLSVTPDCSIEMMVRHQIQSGLPASVSKGLCIALAEYVFNAHAHAHASQIHLYFDKKNRRIIFSDNGNGMAQENFTAFLSYAVKDYKSLNEGPHHNKFNTGSKMMYHYCDTIDVYTHSKEFNKGMHFSLNFGSFISILEARFAGRNASIQHDRDTADSHYWLGKPTGTTFVFSNVDPKVFTHTPSYYAKQLAQHTQMIPSIASLVRVIDRKKMHSLKTIGEDTKGLHAMEFTEEECGLPGGMIARVGISDTGGSVFLNAYQSGISLKDIAQENSELKDLIPSVLQQTGIKGAIWVPFLNEYMQQNRTGFDKSLFEKGYDTLLNLIDPLEQIARPIIEELALSGSNSAAEQQMLKEALSCLILEPHVVTDDDGGGKLPPHHPDPRPEPIVDDFLVNKATHTLEPGGRALLSITKENLDVVSGHYTWKGPGKKVGQLNVQHSSTGCRSALFIAGDYKEDGHNDHFITVCDAEHPTICKQIRIRIVKKLNLKIVPRHKILDDSDTVKFRLDGVSELDTGPIQYEWELEGGEDASLNKDTGLTNTFYADEHSRDCHYTVLVRKKRHDEILEEAFASIEVRAPESKKRKELLRIEDSLYEVMISTEAIPSFIRLIPQHSVDISSGETVHLIMIDMSHQLLKSCGSHPQKCMEILSHTIRKHVDYHYAKQLDIDDLHYKWINLVAEYRS